MIVARERTPAVEPTNAVDVGGLVADLQWIAQRDWRGSPFRSVFGRRLSGGGALVAEDLAEDEQVRAAEGCIVVRRRALAQLLDSRLPPDETLQIAELFVLHEIIHLEQGVGAKKTVRGLRGSGTLGELTLMHLDLGADHLAARALAEARYPGTLKERKALQARSLSAFPFRWPQGKSSLRRKSVRLASLMLDAALREGEVVDGEHPNYFAVDVVPGAAFVHVVELGELMRVWEVEVGGGVSDVLARAAEGGNVSGAVRRIVERMASLFRCRGA